MIFHFGNYKKNPLLFFFQRKSEIPDGIIIGYPFYNTLQRFFIIRIFPVLHPAADQLAHHASEILVSGVGEEASGVGEHADEVSKAA